MRARISATVVSAGLWFLVAPTAQADFDDMLDTLFGVAGADPSLVVNLPDAPLDLRTSDADPLAQLDEVLRRAPADSDAPGDTTRPGDSSATDDSGDPPSLPKINMPSGGSGGSGGSSGSGGGGGGPSNPAPAHSKTKTNVSAAKHGVPLPKETGAE